MASWSFVATDNNFVPLGEVINAKDRKVAVPLNKLSTCSFTTRLDNQLSDALISTACWIKAYRWITGVAAPQLQFFGPVVSAEESADRDNQSIAVNAISGGWILSRRLAGKSSSGRQFTTATDRAQIAKTLIDTTNTEKDSGVSTTIYTPSAASTVTYTAGPYKPVTDCIQELAVAADGFDWLIVPQDNYLAGAVTSTKHSAFRAAPIVGSYQSNAVFEYGAGRNNIVSYRRSMSRDTQANQVYHVGTASGAGAVGSDAKVASNAQSVLSWNLLEDIAQADITDGTLRQQLVNEHVAVRKNPRQIVDFTPHVDPYDNGRVPVFGVDYSVGDSVRARIEYNGKTRLDAQVRCYGWAVDINESGVESQTVTLIQEA